EITLALPTDSAARLTAVAEGATIGTYSFAGYKTSDDEKTKAHNTVLKFITSIAEADELVKRAGVVARATFITRDLVNTAPSHLFPGTFAEEIEALAANSKVEATVFDEEALAEGGFGGLLGVGQGSANPPRLVKLDYRPEKAKGHVAVVGKGITCGSCGISLKRGRSMGSMKSDMAGAATV